MSDSLSRIQLLISQGRFDMAKGEIQRALAHDPQNGDLHALLAICLLQDKENLKEATESAKLAVAASPDEPFSHYVLSLVWDRRGQTEYALDSINEAIRLDPEEANYFALLAQCHLMKDRFQESLEAANQGLSIDPEHIECGNLRSISLERLGRGDEAELSAAQTLARDPDNAGSHAAHGYTLLNAGRYQEAQVAFREALRLEPSNEMARLGMMNALNSRSFLFRAVFGYYVWISRLGQRAGFMLIFGAWILIQVLDRAAAAVPMLRPFVYPLLIAYVAFVVMSWIATPLFNTFLRFHPFGRHLLTRQEFWASNFIASALSLAVFGSVVGFQAEGIGMGILAGMYWFLMATPVAATFAMSTPKRQALCGLATVVVALIPLLGLVRGLQVGLPGPFNDHLQYFFYGILGIQIGSQVINARPVKV